MLPPPPPPCAEASRAADAAAARPPRPAPAGVAPCRRGSRPRWAWASSSI